MSAYGAVIIGGGVNGLTAAAYLARSGMRVLVLERGEDQLGGLAALREFHPGFRANLDSGDGELFLPAVARALGLKDAGLEMAKPEAALMTSLGEDLTLWRDVARTRDALARRSAADAAAYGPFVGEMSLFSEEIRRTFILAPPAADATARELVPWSRAGLRIRRLGRKRMMQLLRVLGQSAADVLDDAFETPALKGLLATAGVVGSLVGPMAVGTAYMMLHQRLGLGEPGWRSRRARDGATGYARALATAATTAGVTIETGREVARVRVRNGRAIGVALTSGAEIDAGVVLSGIEPRRTLLDLIGAAELDVRLTRRLRAIRLRGSTSWVHFALDGLPELAGADADERLKGRLVLAPTMEYLERAHDAAKYGELSPAPLIDARIPSLTEPGRAPAGQHVLTARVQYTPTRLTTGSWSERREEFADAVQALLAEHLGGLDARVVARAVVTPFDLERDFGLTEGDVLQGQMGLDQLLSLRPVPECAQYATPIRDLYLCGAGTHPGGGVTGGNGFNAARAVLRDMRRG